jgi:hypothetical protein
LEIFTAALDSTDYNLLRIEAVKGIHELLRTANILSDDESLQLLNRLTTSSLAESDESLREALVDALKGYSELQPSVVLTHSIEYILKELASESRVERIQVILDTLVELAVESSIFAHVIPHVVGKIAGISNICALIPQIKTEFVTCNFAFSYAGTCLCPLVMLLPAIDAHPEINRTKGKSFG